jgi:hypothetical protein
LFSCELDLLFSTRASHQRKLPETIWEQLRYASGELGKVAALLFRAAALGEMTRHLKLGGYGLRAESP